MTTKAEHTALNTMAEAVNALRTQYEVPRYACDRVIELQDFVKLLFSAAGTLIREANGDDGYLNVDAIVDDIRSCLADEIEAEVLPGAPFTQRSHGTYVVRGGRVA